MVTRTIAARARKQVVGLALALELEDVALALEQRVLLRDKLFAPVEAFRGLGEETLSLEDTAYRFRCRVGF